MNYRKVFAVFLLVLVLGACVVPEGDVEESSTATASQVAATEITEAIALVLPNAATIRAEENPTPTIRPTSNFVSSVPRSSGTPQVLPNAATLRVEEAVTPTYTPTRLPTSTPDLTPIAKTSCNDLMEQIPPNVLRELIITYVNGGAVFIWRGSDCSIQQLTDFENIRYVRLLEDKKVIVFEKFFPNEQFSYAGTIELWAMNLDGTDQRVLLNSRDFEAFYEERKLDFSDPYEFIGLETQKITSIPNSDLVLFNTQIIVTPFPDWSNDLRLLNIKTGELTTIFKANQAGEFFLSPDSTKVAITSPTSLSVYDFTTGKLSSDLLTFKIPAYGTHCCFYAKPIWAADSSRFRVSIPPEEPEADDAMVTLWEIDVSTFLAEELNKYPGRQPIRFSQSLSPDIQHFATYYEDQLEVHKISSGSRSNPVFANDVRLISWNANSINFLYSVGEKLFVGHLTQEPIEINAPQNSIDLDAAFWIDDQYFAHFYEVRDSGERSLSILLGSLDGDSIALLSLQEEGITSLSVKRIP